VYSFRAFRKAVLDAHGRLPLTAKLPAERFEQMFPALEPRQIERFAARGRRRRVEAGEVLIEPGERSPRFFVVTEGEIEIVPASGADSPIAILRRGMFTGEMIKRVASAVGEGSIAISFVQRVLAE